MGGQDLWGKVQEQKGVFTAKVSEFLGELREQLKQASTEKKQDIQNKIDWFQERLSRVRDSMTQQWQAKYAAVVHHMEERISKIKEELQSETNQAKIQQLQDKIAEITKHLQTLKTAVETRYAAVQELLISLTERISAYINGLKAKLQTAAGEAKSNTQSRIAQLESLLSDVQTVVSEKTEAAMRNAQQNFAAMLVALKVALQDNPALASYVDIFSDWVGRLQSTADDEGINDIVGVAVTSDMIDQIVDELQTDGTSRRLTAGEASTQSLQASQAKLWEVADTRSTEANDVPDLQPVSVPTPPPSENPFIFRPTTTTITTTQDKFVISAAVTVKSLGLAVLSVIVTALAIGL